MGVAYFRPKDASRPAATGPFPRAEHSPSLQGVAARPTEAPYSAPPSSLIETHRNWLGKARAPEGFNGVVSSSLVGT